MAAASGDPSPLPRHLGAFRHQQEADALNAASANDAASSSAFRLAVDGGGDAHAQQHGLLWLVQPPPPPPPPPPPSSSSFPDPQQHPPPPPSLACSGVVHDPELLCELMDVKAAFEQTPRGRFSAARARANPYEALVEGSPFLNRSALKMANLNHLVGGALLEAAGPSGGLAFVDLCGGPGGFSQYVLAVQEARGRPARGWGITLEGNDCPWDVEKLGRWIVGAADEEGGRRDREAAAEVEGRGGKRPRSPTLDDGGAGRAPRRHRSHAPGDAATAPPSAPDHRHQHNREQQRQQQQQQQALRLCFGEDGTGDLCRPANVRHFARQVRAEMGVDDGGGVDLVMGDGGFAAARSRFDQEARMLPLIVAEIWAMARTLKKPGGHFVCKLFEATLPGTVQVLALLACTFDRVALVKPVTSRPASAERYVVCLGRCELGGADEAAVDQLLEGMLLRAQEGHTDGFQLQPSGAEALAQSSLVQRVRQLVTGEDGVFVSWLRALNDRMMRCQLEACHAILESIERAEGEEEEEEWEGDAIDVQAYMTAWGLDVLQQEQQQSKT